MPEMPEVETVRRTLTPLVTGRTIEKMVLWYHKIVVGDAEDTARKLAGKKILRLDRYGKYLEFRLSGNLTLVSHLRMEGKYRLTTPEAPKDKHDHIEFIFTDGTALRYNDVRKFGRMHLVETGTERELTGIRHLGPEPNTPEFSTDYFYKALKKKQKNIKTTLLDQNIVCGLGNIYVDEVLWFAQIQPRSRAKDIPQERVKVLHDWINTLIARATYMRGTTVHTFLDADGKVGGYQKMLHVYGRAGEPCDRCNTPLVKIKLQGRGTVYCPHCQTRY